MKFILTSAGLTNESISNALIDLVGKPANEIVFLFVPTAANVEEGEKEWLEEDIKNFQNMGLKEVDTVDIATAPEGEWKEKFRKADVICFGGGSEQYLARVAREIGLKEFLLEILEGKVYMGISAGSMITGKFMPKELLKMIYPEEIFEGEQEPSLGFVDLCFVPHLNSDWFTHVRKETLELLKDKVPKPLYALDDETALVVDNENIVVVGTGNRYIQH